MLFVRDFLGFTGGHLKFADYIRHTASSALAEPVLYQTPRSRTTPGNIFNDLIFKDFPGLASIGELRAFPAYFVAGEDWFILDAAGIGTKGRPVVNLIQGFRHADRDCPLFGCLSRPALRICVSPAVAEAIRPHANGEVQVIENGVEPAPPFLRRPLDAPPRALIAGFKNPGAAEAVAARLQGRLDIDLLTEQTPRAEFMARVAMASICVMLPLPREGFFLPPLEAMALGRAVIAPDCGGNLAYSRPGENCLMPVYAPDALATAVLTLAQDPVLLRRLAEAGAATAAASTLTRERAAYQAILAGYLRSFAQVARETDASQRNVQQ